MRPEVEPAYQPHRSLLKDRCSNSTVKHPISIPWYKRAYIPNKKNAVRRTETGIPFFTFLPRYSISIPSLKRACKRSLSTSAAFTKRTTWSNKPPKSYPNNISPTKKNNNMISFCIKWKLEAPELQAPSSELQSDFSSEFPFNAKTYHVVISNRKMRS